MKPQRQVHHETPSQPAQHEPSASLRTPLPPSGYSPQRSAKASLEGEMFISSPRRQAEVFCRRLAVKPQGDVRAHHECFELAARPQIDVDRRPPSFPPRAGELLEILTATPE